MTTKEKNIKEVAFVQFANQAIENLRATSRTAKGISDTSSSVEKQVLRESGDALKERTRENFERALEYAWEHRYATFSTPEELREFIEGAAKIVSEGLTKDEALFRTWATKLAHQTPPDHIEPDFNAFVEELYGKLHATHADGYATAAFVEQRLDSRVHPFADGCGRTAKVVSSWVLSRYHLQLPQWQSRDEYYMEIEKDIETWIQYYKKMCSENKEAPRVIHAHRFVDADAAASLWVYQRYAIPDGQEVETKFVSSGDKDPALTDVFLDISGGIKGKKDEDSRTHSCFKLLMELYAPREEREDLEYLIGYIDGIDTYGPTNLLKGLDPQTVKIVQEGLLKTTLDCLRQPDGQNDKELCAMMGQILEGALRRGKLRRVARAEAERAEFPFGQDVAIIKENKGGPITADFLFEKGARVVIYTDGFNVGVTRKDGETFNLKDMLEPELKKRESGWFFHEHGFLAARGTFTNPSETPSTTTPEEIAKIIYKKLSIL